LSEKGDMPVCLLYLFWVFFWRFVLFENAAGRRAGQTRAFLMCDIRPAVFFLLLPLTFSAFAQPVRPDLSAHPYVEATGEATLSAKPDQAEIDIGVTSQGPMAGEVAAQNAKQVDGVLKEIRGVLGSAAGIKTNRYSINPNYTYSKPGGSATIAGYTATNTVQVTVPDLHQVGKVIDVATQSGANAVQQIEFTLKNDEQVRTQVLREAAARARANAGAMASGLGLRLGKVLSVEQTSCSSVVPRSRPVAMAANTQALVPTPVESGTIDVRATVTIRIEVTQ
jgi:uncharacterized protein YggE